MVNKKEIVKGRLIDAAIKVIGTKGFRKTTVPMITKKAGVGTGTFYLYFKDKSHVFGEAVVKISSELRNYIEDVFQKQLELFRGRSAGPGDIAIAQHAIYSAFFDYVDNYRSHFMILFREGLSHNEDLAGILWQTYKNIAEDTSTRVLTASQLGFIRPMSSLEAKTIGWAMVGMLSQVAQLYMTGGYDRDELVKILVSFTLDGIQRERSGI